MLVVVDDSLGALLAIGRLGLPSPYTLAVTTAEFRFRMVKPFFIDQPSVGTIQRIINEDPDPARAVDYLKRPHTRVLRAVESEEILVASLEAWAEGRAAGITMNRLSAGVVGASRALGGLPVRLSLGNAAGQLVEALDHFAVDVAVWDLSGAPEVLFSGVTPELSIEAAQQRLAERRAERDDETR